MGKLLLTICLSLLFHLKAAMSVEVSRNTNGDVITSDKCDANACSRYGGVCIDSKQCQCQQDRSTFLGHVNRCVPNRYLSTTLFGDKGCPYRLVANSYRDSKPRGSKACIFQELSLYALDPMVSGSQLIDICGIFTWSISSCSVVSGAYYDDGKWKDIWHAGSNQSTFSVVKRLGVTLYLKWSNNTLPFRYHGHVISLDIRCKRKFNRTIIESCLVVKVKKTKIGDETDVGLSTPLPRNSTGTPLNEKTSKLESFNGQGSDDIAMIVIGVTGGLFLVVLVFLMVWCLKKRRYVMITRWKMEKQPKRNQGSMPVAMTSSPLYDMNEFQSDNENEAPVYVAPAQTSGYQDLLFSKNTYQSLVPNTSGDILPPSPIYQTVQEPGNNNIDVTDHVYQVLEEPS